jgi:transposase-like protein
MDSRVEAGKPKVVQPNITLANLKKQYSDDTACKQLLADMRWNGKVECPRCGETERVYALKAKAFHWVCKSGKTVETNEGWKSTTCHRRNGYRFSVLSGTIFENTNYPLATWFEVIYLMTQSKKGISALQIHRQIGSGDYRTAWYMCMRIRGAMEDTDFPKLMGEVEVDETYMGGKRGKMHKSKRRPDGWGTKGKTAVIGAISRKGSVVAQMCDYVDERQAHKFIQKVVDPNVTLISTDEAGIYRNLDQLGYRHETVDHKAEEYVRGDAGTQNIDNFWSMLKRGVIGTYHKVSAKYLPMYLAEFQFRYNARRDPDIFRKVLAGC